MPITFQLKLCSFFSSLKFFVSSASSFSTNFHHVLLFLFTIHSSLISNFFFFLSYSFCFILKETVYRGESKYSPVKLEIRLITRKTLLAAYASSILLSRVRTNEATILSEYIIIFYPSIYLCIFIYIPTIAHTKVQNSIKWIQKIIIPFFIMHKLPQNILIYNMAELIKFLWGNTLILFNY